MYCDCQVAWFADWVRESGLTRDVAASCSHPESLLGRDIFHLEKSQLVCGTFFFLPIFELCGYTKGAIYQVLNTISLGLGSSAAIIQSSLGASTDALGLLSIDCLCGNI